MYLMGDTLAACIDWRIEVIVEGHGSFLARVDGVSVGVGGVCCVDIMLLKRLRVAIYDVCKAHLAGQIYLFHDISTNLGGGFSSFVFFTCPLHRCAISCLAYVLASQITPLNERFRVIHWQDCSDGSVKASLRL